MGYRGLGGLHVVVLFLQLYVIVPLPCLFRLEAITQQWIVHTTTQQKRVKQQYTCVPRPPQALAHTLAVHLYKMCL